MKKIYRLILLGLFGMISIGASAIPNNTIYYTSLDGNVVNPYRNDAFGDAVIVSNEYSNGQGIITLDRGVISIGMYAFYNSTNLTSIEIPNSVVSIGGSAFDDCEYLSSVTMGNSITSVGFDAFQRCWKLKSVHITDIVKWAEIEFDFPAANPLYYAHNLYLNGELVKDVNLESAKKIGDNAFYGCDSLNTVGDLPKCRSIGTQAFMYCGSLSSVGTLPICESIGSGAFGECCCLTSFGELPVCKSIGSAAFNNCGRLGKLTLSCSTMAECLPSFNCPGLNLTLLVPSKLVNAYRSADSWSTIEDFNIIPMEVQTDYSIQTKADDNSSSIQKVIGEEYLNNVISLKVTGDINGYDFMVMRNKMKNLHYVDFSEANIVEDANHYCYYANCYTQNNIFPDNAFYQSGNIMSLKFPNTITEIGNFALSHTSITEIEIPYGVKNIGIYAFEYSVSKIKIPNSVINIGEHAFESCGLAAVELPNSVQNIGDFAFAYCYGLKSIVIPSGVKSIGDCSFASCINLESVYVASIIPLSIGQNTFSNYQTATLYVPMKEDTEWTATYYAYYWDTQWSQFLNIASWEPNYDYFFLDGNYELDKGEIPGDNPDADFGRESGFIVDEDAQQGMGEANISSDGENGGSIIAQDKQDGTGNVTIENLKVNIDVYANRWYFFCFPYDIQKEDIVCDANYVFRHYDGQSRATHGNSGWKDVTNENGTYLKAGKGYIFQCDRDCILTLPAQNVTLDGKDKQQDLETYASSNAQDDSWNFVGNPFLSYFNLEELGYNAPITIWNGYSYEAIRPGDDDYSFHPFQAFFVQKPEGTDAIDFFADGRETKTQSQKNQNAAKIARMHKKAAVDRQLINLTISDGVNTDKTRVVFNSKKADAYERDCDASKFMSTEKVPQIYTLDNKNVKYAINERPSGSVKLGYVATKAGTLTISASRMEREVVIKDNLTGRTHALADGDVTFETEAGTFNERFVMHLGDTNGINETKTNDSEKSEVFDLTGKKLQGVKKGVNIANGKKFIQK